MNISVIVPTFNRAEYLRETICAVLAQTRRPDEVLVVDDGSDDHTREVIATFGAEVTALHKPNSGKADSLNQALAQVSGSHIWIVDDDDLPCPDALETLIGCLVRSPGAEIAYGPHDRFAVDPDTGCETRQETGYWDDRSGDWFLVATMEDFFAHQPGMLVARDLYDRVGPFDTEMIASEDYEMLLRLAQAGQAVATDRIVFHQRQHAGLRGQQGHQFTASDRNRKWVEYDQKIFHRVHETFPLADYLPKHFALSPETTRQALLQRGAVMLRKQMSDLALADLREAAKLTPEADLSDDERAVLRRSLLSKYGCEAVLRDSQTVRALSDLAQSSAVGKAIVRAIARSLLWQARVSAGSGQISKTLFFSRIFVHLAL